MISSTLQLQVSTRVKQLRSDVQRWLEVPPEVAISFIKIRAKKPIKMIGMEIVSDENPLFKVSGSEGVSTKNQPSELLSGGEYIAKWNSRNDYQLIVEINPPAVLRAFGVNVKNRNDDNQWLFGSSITYEAESGVIKTVGYSDGINWQSNDPAESDLVQLFRNSSHRDLPKETFALYKKIKETRTKEEFCEIENLLRSILDTHTLSPHGYLRSLVAADKTKLSAGLQDALSAIQNNGYTIFAASGTLLGAMRDGQFIGHDDDIDFGVFLSGDDFSEVFASMMDFERFLKSANLLRTSIFNTDGPTFHWKLNYIAGVNIDIFPAWGFDGKLFAWPYCYGDADIKDLMPTRDVNVGGIRLPAPSNPERILSVNYGSSWRVPDPTFCFNWKQASGKFSEYIKNIRKFRNQDSR